MAEIALLLAIGGALVGFLRADVALIMAAVVLGLASGARQHSRRRA